MKTKIVIFLLLSWCIPLTACATTTELLGPYEYVLREKNLSEQMKMSRAGYKAALTLLALRQCNCLQSSALKQKSTDGYEGIVQKGQYYYEVRFINFQTEIEAVVFVNEPGTWSKVLCSTHDECVAPWSKTKENGSAINKSTAKDGSAEEVKKRDGVN